MATRRDLIRSGALLSLTVPLSGAGWAATPTKQSLRPTTFIYDSRYLTGVELAKQLKSIGIAATAISGDLWNLWYDKLDKKWRKAPDIVAGYTGEDDLFVLHTLAVDRGMRLFFKGQHRMIEDHYLSNEFVGSSAAARALSEGREMVWTSRLSAVLANCPINNGPVQKARILTKTKAFKSQPTLYSWLLGPSHAARQALIA